MDTKVNRGGVPTKIDLLRDFKKRKSKQPSIVDTIRGGDGLGDCNEKKGSGLLP